MRRRRRHRQGNFAANCVRGAVLRVRDLPQNFVEGEPKGGNRSLRHRRGRLLPPLQRVEFLDTLQRPGNRPAFCLVSAGGRRKRKAPVRTGNGAKKAGAVQKRSKHKEALALLRRAAKLRSTEKIAKTGRWQGAGTPASFVDAKRRQRSQRSVLVRFCGKASLCALR